MTERLYETGPPLISLEDARFTAQVISSEPREDRTAVVLDRTLFFPTGGGQPCDHGTLAGRRVVEVSEISEEDGEVVVHLLEGAGAFEGEVVGEVDLARRRDLAEQHSGQHLLSAVLLRHGVETRSFHLGKDVTIDVPDRGVDASLLRRVEVEVNQAIRDALPVRATLHTGDDARAAAASLRKPPTEAALTAPRGLRIVTFGHDDAPLDRDPCCGTHVDHTGRLGALLILGQERGRKGELRIFFAAGGRAHAAARERLDALSGASETLTTGFRELPERAEKLLGQVKQISRELKRTREQALGLQAEALARETSAFVSLLACDEAEPGQLRSFARAFFSVRPTASLVLTHRPEGKGRLTLAVARGPKARTAPSAKDVLSEALAALGGKGGGTDHFAQGAAPAPDAAAVTHALERAVERLG